MYNAYMHLCFLFIIYNGIKFIFDTFENEVADDDYYDHNDHMHT